MDPFPIVETYLSALSRLHRSRVAVPETSTYPILEELLTAVGALPAMRPRGQAVVPPRNRGAGIPDLGLFTADQLVGAVLDGWPGPAPARGVIEAKAADAAVDEVAQSQQVLGYAEHYGRVLVTNGWDFLLLEGRDDGRAVPGERFRLAANEQAFWQIAAIPQTLHRADAERFVQFLQRVLLHAAPIVTHADLAWFLASYAREASARIERRGLGGLTALRTALEDALGVKFSGEQGQRFFRSTLVQTLFYGVFSAWVLWSRERSSDAPDRFNWRETEWTLHVPFIRELYHQIATASTLKPLGLDELLGWAGDALNRVDRARFFERFAEEHAVQYFYEPFLEAFDPELRKQLGVWYTPPEVVEYMVARVDTVLRTELGRPDGLADPDVYVLDPCTGTGSYLVEVIRRIDATLRARGEDALTGSDLKHAVLGRVFGFELLPAPFVVAHLQIGLLLQTLGAPLSHRTQERAGVYLTNALTGWHPPVGPQQHLPFAELERERDAADEIKQRRAILVVLGNPPYNGYAGVAIQEERDLTDAYRVARRVKPPQGQGLNDLYIRFFRMAERRIVEMTGEGVVCFISNYSWLDGLSFTAMRERYLDAFDRIWIDSLNGDKYKTGKLTPTGEPDPSVFSTERNREGIQVGTAVALLARRRDHAPAQGVKFRSLWGRAKRADLLATAVQRDDRLYETVAPDPELGLPFLPMASGRHYLSWPTLPELFPVSFPGVKTSRDDVLVDIDRDRLRERMRRYFDPSVSHEELRRLLPGAMEAAAGFDPVATRDHLRRRGFLPDKIVRYAYRPFDVRWLYWEPETKLLDRKREEYVDHVFPGNLWLSAGQRNRKDVFYQPQFATVLADHHIVESNVSMFPLYLRRPDPTALLGLGGATSPSPNLSPAAAAYLAAIGADPDDLFFHAFAVLHAPAYRTENRGALRQDWPRVSLPASRDLLLASARLGRDLALLLDAESLERNVAVAGKRKELQTVAAMATRDGQPIDPNGDDLALTAGWGYAGNGGVTMPGQGRIESRPYSPAEAAALEAAINPLGLSLADTTNPLGATTFDVYLNDRARWRNVPSRVWTYALGGYPVLKKWLSYRERPLLGRPLTATEARQFQEVARRIAAILLLEPRLDANYHATAADASTWRSPAATAEGLRLW